MTRTIALIAAAAALAGCASSSPKNASAGALPPKVAAASRPADKASFDQIKQLAGTWQMKDEKGEVQDASIFAVSSNGSVVREIMFPGTQHEMTNVYHLDGPSLIMTHYCAVGNQPRMRATETGGERIHFKFDSVTNLTKAQDHVMSDMTLVIKDQDTILEEWRSQADGKVAEQPMVFTLTRKK
jgi:hypothetical protein